METKKTTPPLSREEEEIDLVETFGIIWRYKLTIIILTLLGALIPIALTLSKGEQKATLYRSSAVLSFSNDPMTRQTQGPLYQEILQSNSTFQKINQSKRSKGKLEVEFVERTGIMHVNYYAKTAETSLKTLEDLVSTVNQAFKNFEITPLFVIVDPPFANGKTSTATLKKRVVQHFVGAFIGFAFGLFLAFTTRFVHKIRNDKAVRERFLNP